MITRSFHRHPAVAPQEPAVRVARERRHVFIFHWEGWRRFLGDFAVLQGGLALLGLSISLLIRSGLGQIPWGVIEYWLLDRLPVHDMGLVFLVLLVPTVFVAVILREPFGWGSLVNVLFITAVWIDVFEGIIPVADGAIGVQILYLVTGTVLMAFGTAIYIGVGAGAGPRDTVALALARHLRVGVGVAWTILQAILVLIGWLLGGSFGPGTFVFMLTIGPAVQVAFALLRVEPQADFWRRLA